MHGAPSRAVELAEVNPLPTAEHQFALLDD